MKKIKADSRFGLLRDAFASRGEDHNVRVTAFSASPDLHVCFDLSMKTAERLGKNLLKYVKERRDHKEQLRKSLQNSKHEEVDKS